MHLLLRRALGFGGLLATLAVLVACSSAVQKPKPQELPSNPGLLGVKLAWTAKIGEVRFPLDAKAVADAVAVASSDGTVAVIDAQTGRDQWRAVLREGLSAGVGFDGKTLAVLTRGNELVALRQGQEIWRQRLTAQGYTAPLVAGGRVFFLSADRSVSAYDADSGRRLWTQSRTGEALVLQQAGVLMAVGDTLVAGLSGRLVGFNPLNGSVRWEAPLASPRGTNDVERLVDLVAQVSRRGDVVCARAFQAAVGCVDAGRGALLWTRQANGSVGLHGADDLVFGAEADGTLIAWRRADGERAWTQERFKHRQFGAPFAVGRSVIVGDAEGWLHFLSREDGSTLSRVATDASPMAGPAVLSGNTLVVVSRKGGIFAYRPE